MSKLTINYDENVIFYIVDKNDDEEYYDSLPEDEKKALDDLNEKWIEEHLTPKLISLTGFCPCRMPEVMDRTTRRAMLTATRPGTMINPTVEQEDVDAYKFIVVVVADKDKYEDISLIIRECKSCAKLDFWGDSTMLGGQLADLINTAYTAAEYRVGRVCIPDGAEGQFPLGDDMVLENLDTGEWTTADGEPADIPAESAEPETNTKTDPT